MFILSAIGFKGVTEEENKTNFPPQRGQAMEIIITIFGHTFLCS